jgi:hypothetical protein
MTIPTHLALARGRVGTVTAHVVVDGELESRTRGRLHRHAGEALCAKPYGLRGALLDDATVHLARTGHAGAYEVGRAVILEAQQCLPCMARYHRLLTADEVEPHCRRTHAGPMPEVLPLRLREGEDDCCPRCGSDDFGAFTSSDGERRANCLDCGLTIGPDSSGRLAVL